MRPPNLKTSCKLSPNLANVHWDILLGSSCSMEHVHNNPSSPIRTNPIEHVALLPLCSPSTARTAAQYCHIAPPLPRQHRTRWRFQSRPCLCHYMHYERIYMCFMATPLCSMPTSSAYRRQVGPQECTGRGESSHLWLPETPQCLSLGCHHDVKSMTLGYRWRDGPTSPSTALA